MALRKLYPPIAPYSSGYLPVGDGHQIYWEQSGNPEGVPVFVLHGGPGAGAGPQHRQFFDPAHYRIVIFDQRGCGRSEPLAAETDFPFATLSPAAMVADIEALRQHLHIRKMHLFGGSWGSTLALLYAAAYPHHCISLLLRSVFLLSHREVEWFLYGMRRIFPETWEDFAQFVPENERADLLGAYERRLNAPDDDVAIAAALHWVAYESGCSLLYPHVHTVTSDAQRRAALTLARTEAYFFRHHLLDGADALIRHIDTFRHIPATIIQGRYDVIAPIETAYALHKLWPEADYIVVPDGGHASIDPSMRSRLVDCTDSLRTIR